MKSNMVLYIHGKGGNANEAEFYRPLFPEYDVIGLDYKADTPWQFAEENNSIISGFAEKYNDIIVIANSIGAFFAMNSLPSSRISRAFFISPILDMEKLICGMMAWANVSESRLRSVGTIKTAFGETLSWEYLCYVRDNPLQWNVPTEILYGSEDNLTAYETAAEFAAAHNAGLTVMNGGEHWFHTERQMQFLSDWLKSKAPEICR